MFVRWHMKKNGLWTKDFSCITISTILSAIGGEAMNLPISLLVFQETKSTLLSAIIMICGMLPDILLPIIVAPIIDKTNKKTWIVILDTIMIFIYVVMGIWTMNNEFSYALYVIFVLVVGTISVFYQLAYNAWYPDLIPLGHEQRGFSVSSTIYPMVIVIASPIVTFVYDKVSIGNIFLFVALINLI